MIQNQDKRRGLFGGRRGMKAVVIAGAVAAGVLLMTSSRAMAGGHSSFSIGFSFGSGHSFVGGHYGHYGHYGSGFGVGYHSYYYRPYNDCYPSYSYYHYHPYVYYTPGVTLGYSSVNYYDNNTAQLVVPPASVYTTATVPVTTTTTYATPAPAPAPTYDYPYQADGWALLRSGQSRQAIDAFADQAQRYPNAGLPKLGYAISQGVVGNDTKTAWALRKVLQYDANALDNVPADAQTRQQIVAVINRYQKRAQGFAHADDPLIIASMLYIQRDYNGAKAALGTVDGVTDPAVHTLSTMIEQHLSTNPPAVQPSAPSGYQYPYQSNTNSN